MRAAVLLCWLVTGTLVRVVDGDTAVLSLSLWHGLTATEFVRVLNVDTPELRGGTPESQAAGVAAKQFTEAWLARGPMTVETCARDSFGRVLGTISRDGASLGDDLLRAGHAVEDRR